MQLTNDGDFNVSRILSVFVDSRNGVSGRVLAFRFVVVVFGVVRNVVDASRVAQLDRLDSNGPSDLRRRFTDDLDIDDERLAFTNGNVLQAAAVNLGRHFSTNENK